MELCWVRRLHGFRGTRGPGGFQQSVSRVEMTFNTASPFVNCVDISQLPGTVTKARHIPSLRSFVVDLAGGTGSGHNLQRNRKNWPACVIQKQTSGARHNQTGFVTDVTGGLEKAVL